MDYKAFTLAESLIVMMIVGIIYVAMLNILRPGDISKDVLQKSGAKMMYQLDFASKQILAKNSVNYNFYNLKTASGTQFSITADKADEKLMDLFKKYLKGLRNVNVSATYLGTTLRNESNGTITNVTPSTFKYGFFTNNNAYIAIKLNKNCTTTETYIYSPVLKSNRSVTNSCGLIFFDVNGDKEPNTLGIDQYIVSIGKSGVK